MPQRTKTVEYVFETGTALRSTVTALAGTNFYTPAAITVHLPETDTTRTIRSVELIVTARDAETTTARRVDGARIGVQIDAVAFSDVDLTGTGITNTGDPYSVVFIRDVTSYFVTNFTAASHSVGMRVEFETDVASLVNNITAKLRITYEYNDTSATYAKTVRIPLEGITGFLTTTANSNFQGSTGAAQIPALDTFLPESGKTYRQIWFEIYATDAGTTGTTDFNASYSVDGATTRVGATLEQGLSGSAVYYDIWLTPAAYFTTDATHNFQAWSSLASRFERMSATLCVTYTYTKPVSGTVLNSIVLPVCINAAGIQGLINEKDRWTVDLWVEEPTTITLRQSAVFLTYYSPAGATTFDVRVNSQGATSSAYTNTNLTSSGVHTLQHRIDVAHGGTAVTLARGQNTLVLDVFTNSASINGIGGLTGVFIINYESGIAAGGEGAHNHTTWWKLWSTHEGVIAGDGYREVATTNQRTPNIPEASAFYQGIAHELRANLTGASTGTIMQVLMEVLTGELAGDGWQREFVFCGTDGEFGMSLHWLVNCTNGWDRWVNDPQERMNPEVARLLRWNSSHNAQWACARMITYHAITFAITGSVTNSAGGTVSITAHRADTGEQVGSTSRVGDGSYTVTVYDNTKTYFAAARESATLLGRSDNATPA